MTALFVPGNPACKSKSKQSRRGKKETALVKYTKVGTLLGQFSLLSFRNFLQFSRLVSWMFNKLSSNNHWTSFEASDQTWSHFHSDIFSCSWILPSLLDLRKLQSKTSGLKPCDIRQEERRSCFRENFSNNSSREGACIELEWSCGDVQGGTYTL